MTRLAWGTLMSVAWDQQRIEPINVYGPSGTEALVKAAVQYFTRTGITTQATRGHLSPEDVGKMAARAGVNTVVLTHLTFTPNETDYAAWAAEVRKHFSGRVVVADDLREF